MSTAIDAPYIQYCIYNCDQRQCLPSPALGAGGFPVFSTAGRNHLRGVLQAGFGHLCAAYHAGYFVHAGAIVEQADLHLGAAIGLALFNDEVLIGEGGDLGQVRYAQHLLAAAQGLQLLPDGFGRAAADADIDFVEDQGSGRRGFAFRLWLRPLPR